MGKGKYRQWVGAIALAVAVSAVQPASAGDPQTGRQVNPNVDVPEFGSLSAETDGRKLFESICQGCHMPDAKGAKGAGMYPALAGNPQLNSPAYPIYVVINGLRAMPDFGKHLTDEQIANVVNYVITHFGNAAPAQASADDVSAARASH
jgi:mono/diheme cytochrome c family protein